MREVSGQFCGLGTWLEDGGMAPSGRSVFDRGKVRSLMWTWLGWKWLWEEEAEASGCTGTRLAFETKAWDGGVDHGWGLGKSGQLLRGQQTLQGQVWALRWGPWAGPLQ